MKYGLKYALTDPVCSRESRGTIRAATVQPLKGLGNKKCIFSFYCSAKQSVSCQKHQVTQKCTQCTPSINYTTGVLSKTHRRPTCLIGGDLDMLHRRLICLITDPSETDMPHRDQNACGDPLETKMPAIGILTHLFKYSNFYILFAYLYWNTVKL